MRLNRSSLENPKADLKKNKAETWPGEAWANNKTEQLLTVAEQITQRPMEIKLNLKLRDSQR